MLPRRDFLAIAASAASLAARPSLLPDPEAWMVPSLGVFELRHYRTESGRREDLVTLFETYFLDAYEAAGAIVLGTFRNLDAPDRWAWIRAFPSLAAREAALKAFYTGEAWRTHGEACNATLADVSEARILAPVRGAALAVPPPRPPRGGAVPPAVYEATIYDLPEGTGDDFARFHATRVHPALEGLGEAPIAVLLTGPGMRSDPKRPVCPGTYLVVLGRHPDEEAQRHAQKARQASRAWREMEREVASRLRAPTQVWRLQPTPRSALR